MKIRSFKKFFLPILMLTTTVNVQSADVGSGYRWDQPGIPHTGWTHQGVDDLGPHNYQTCGMCNNQKVRFVHTMSHPNHDLLEVGCVCASNMDTGTDARGLENTVKRKATRQANWGHLNGWKASKKAVCIFAKIGWL